MEIFLDKKLDKTSEFRGIVRVCGKDMKGELPLAKALTRIRGLGVNLADSIAEIAIKELKISKMEIVGNLTDAQIDALEEIIHDPVKYGIPLW